MKKLITLTALFFFATKLIAQTTEEEYNYLTKGYKIQVESGLDMKMGYKMVLLSTSSNNSPNINRNVEFYSLIKTATNKQSAVLMIYKEKNEKFYYCIPTINSTIEMKSKCLNDIMKDIPYYGGNERVKTLLWGFMLFAMSSESKQTANKTQTLDEMLKDFKPNKP